MTCATVARPDKRDDKNDQTSVDAQWARDQHARVTNAVRRPLQGSVVVVALALSNRGPATTSRTSENDRTLKQCMTYINAAREQEAERSNAHARSRSATPDEAKRPAPAADSRRIRPKCYCIHLRNRDAREAGRMVTKGRLLAKKKSAGAPPARAGAAVRRSLAEYTPFFEPRVVVPIRQAVRSLRLHAV